MVIVSLTMPMSTIKAANAVMNRKDGPMPRSAMAKSKPFVVTSLTTKRHALSDKMPAQKQLAVPPLTSAEERLSVPRGVPKKQTSRWGSPPTVGSKTVPRRSCDLMPRPGSNATTRVRMPPHLPLVPSVDRLLREKNFAPKPPKITQRLKGGKLVGGCLATAPVIRSTQVAAANELPPRPSCVPRIHLSSVGAPGMCKGKQVITVNTGPHKPRIALQGLSVNIPQGSRRVKATGASVKKPFVADACRTRMLTRDQKLTPPQPIVAPPATKPTPYVTEPPPASPVLSSFPSQSWTIVVNVDMKPLSLQTTICDETLSSVDDALKSGVAGTPNSFCEHSESGSSPPTASSSPTVIEASASIQTAELYDIAKINSQTKVSPSEVSRMICAATIISPLKNGAASSMASLARVMDSQASSPTEASESFSRTRMTIQRAIDTARNLFPPSQRALQSCTETVSTKTTGNNVSRIRKLFIPPLDEDAKASKNPATQMEIEMLRARRKVAGGGVVDPRLDRLTSLAAMKIVTKRLGMSGSESPSHV